MFAKPVAIAFIIAFLFVGTRGTLNYTSPLKWLSHSLDDHCQLKRSALYCIHFDERLWRQTVVFFGMTFTAAYCRPRNMLKQIRPRALKCPQIIKKHEQMFFGNMFCTRSQWQEELMLCLCLRVFFHVIFSCVSSLKISQVNAQSRHVSRCQHTQDMPPGVWGQVTLGWAVKSTQAGRWRGRLRGLDQAFRKP